MSYLGLDTSLPADLEIEINEAFFDGSELTCISVCRPRGSKPAPTGSGRMRLIVFEDELYTCATDRPSYLHLVVAIVRNDRDIRKMEAGPLSMPMADPRHDLADH